MKKSTYEEMKRLYNKAHPTPQLDKIIAVVTIVVVVLAFLLVWSKA